MTKLLVSGGSLSRACLDAWCMHTLALLTKQYVNCTVTTTSIEHGTIFF